MSRENTATSSVDECQDRGRRRERVMSRSALELNLGRGGQAGGRAGGRWASRQWAGRRAGGEDIGRIEKAETGMTWQGSAQSWWRRQRGWRQRGRAWRRQRGQWQAWLGKGALFWWVLIGRAGDGGDGTQYWWGGRETETERAVTGVTWQSSTVLMGFDGEGGRQRRWHSVLMGRAGDSGDGTWFWWGGRETAAMALSIDGEGGRRQRWHSVLMDMRRERSRWHHMLYTNWSRH
jgi:hypothetical protein